MTMRPSADTGARALRAMFHSMTTGARLWRSTLRYWRGAVTHG